MSGETDWLDLANTGAQVGSSLYASQQQADASSDAADQLSDSYAQGLQASQGAILEGRKDLLNTGTAGLEDLITGFQGAVNVMETPGQAEMRAGGLSGAYGADAQQQAMNEFLSSPGQEYLRGEQEDALIRNAAAIGGLGGGRVRTALQEQAYGRAATNQQQALNNMMMMMTPEQTRSTNIANLLSAGGGQLANYRSGIGSNLANIALGGASQQIPLITGTGQAQAAGTLGSANALAQGMGNVSNTLGNLSL